MRVGLGLKIPTFNPIFLALYAVGIVHYPSHSSATTSSPCTSPRTPLHSLAASPSFKSRLIARIHRDDDVFGEMVSGVIGGLLELSSGALYVERTLTPSRSSDNQDVQPGQVFPSLNLDTLGKSSEAITSVSPPVHRTSHCTRDNVLLLSPFPANLVTISGCPLLNTCSLAKTLAESETGILVEPSADAEAFSPCEASTHLLHDEPEVQDGPAYSPDTVSFDEDADEPVAYFEEPLDNIAPAPSEIVPGCDEYGDVSGELYRDDEVLANEEGVCDVYMTDAEDDDSDDFLYDHNNNPYRILGLVGQGASGIVMAAMNQFDRNNVVAIKVIHKDRYYSQPLMRQQLLQEKHFLEQAAREGTPFITKLLSSWEDNLNVYFVMRFSSDTLLDRIEREKKLSKNEVRVYCAELVAALQSLESMRIVHSDFKADNILLDLHGCCKVADFGMSASVPEGKEFDSYAFSGLCGTPGFVAPEVLYTSARTRAADIWSVGMIVLMLMAGLKDSCLPVKSFEEQRKHIEEQYLQLGKGWLQLDNYGLNPTEISFLEKMLELNPETRWRPDALMEHPYLAEIDWMQLVYPESGDQYDHDYIPPNTAGIIDFQSKSLSFYDFHRGKDPIFNHVPHERSSAGWITPTEAARRQKMEGSSLDFVFDGSPDPWEDDRHGALHM
ncbi:Protein kinase 2 [Grifola frondosa]|uniref:Protein kinase 2 n=1 Tax=Grifola frondosa TaxID=5627 RepID=A0A1C7MFY0_GRIFR|nr:Protein kinase 2 [Grifola frondosa]